MKPAIVVQGSRSQTGVIQTPRRHLCLPVVLVWLSFALPFATQAQTTAPLPPEVQEAVKKGILAAKQQDYLLATRFFQDARKIAPQAPEIYYDLGLAESKIPGRELRAICWFEAYLTATPQAANVAALKDQVDVLDVKSQSNLSRMIKSVQDAASKVSNNNKAYQWQNFSDVADLWAGTGDIAAAFKAADFGRNRYPEITIEGIARARAKADDIAGALITADRLQNANDKNISHTEIAEVLAEAGDITEALNTADLIQDAHFKDEALSDIAKAQAKAGDVTGALKTADLIQNAGDNKDKAYEAIVDAQIMGAAVGAGDIAGAQKTAELIQDVSSKGFAQSAIARAKASQENWVIFSPRTAAQPLNLAAIPVIRAVDWLNKLDDGNPSADCALNTEPFLDLAGYLKSLPPSDNPQEVFKGLEDVAKKYVTAQNTIDRMLKLQAKR